MKIKNHYAWIFVLWILCTLLNCVSCVVNFVDGRLLIGFIFLAVACGFAFASGMLLEKSIRVHEHNKACDFLEAVHEYLREQNQEQEPFEEFESEKR